MLGLGFWNLGNRDLSERVVELIDEYSIDLLVLAEAQSSFEQLSSLLDSKKWKSLHDVPQRLCTFTRLPRQRIMLSYGDSLQYLEGWTVHVLPEPINLVTIHAPSKQYQNEYSQLLQAVDFAGQIQRLETDQGHDRTIIIGDLNMNPFEPGMVAATGLHGMMTQTGVRRISRLVRGTTARFFYNPMWSFFGDLSPGPPGTFFRQHSDYLSYEWHMFDQVLMRPSLIPFFDDDVEIISSIKGRSLLRKNRRPDLRIGSDHLPIRASFNLDVR